MEYSVYKKIEEHYRFILNLVSADITEVPGKIKKEGQAGVGFTEITQHLEERLRELQFLRKGFANEVKLNTNEDDESFSKYFMRLDEELNYFRETFLQLLERWKQLKIPGKINEALLQLIKKLITSIEIFMDILVSHEPFTLLEFTNDFTPKLVYMQFSGIIDGVRNSLKEKLHPDCITNVRLAETLALITDENQVIIEKWLPQLSHLAGGKPHPFFNSEMITNAITCLEKDGFDASTLHSLIKKMN